MKHVDLRDLIGGSLLIAFGLAVVAYASTHYDIGTAARMGPGYFPMALGWAMSALGALIALLALRNSVRNAEATAFSLRPLTAVLMAVAAFALTVNRLGLVPATVLATCFSALAESRVNVKRTLLLAVALAALAWLIFTLGLQMDLPAFAFLD